MTNPLDFVLDLESTRRCPFKWATVTGVGPLRIRLDGPGAPLEYTPQSLEGGHKVGGRVFVVFTGKNRNKPVVLGKANPFCCITITPNSSYTVTDWRYNISGDMATVWGQFTKNSGNVANGDTLGTVNSGSSILTTSTGQGQGNTTSKVTIDGNTIKVASTPTGGTPYIRVDGMSWLIGG